MDAQPIKRKRRRIKKTRVKQPTGFKLKMTNFFGPAYLEYSMQIHIGIAIIIVLLVALVVLLIISPPPPVPAKTTFNDL